MLLGRANGSPNNNGIKIYFYYKTFCAFWSPHYVHHYISYMHLFIHHALHIQSILDILGGLIPGPPHPYPPVVIQLFGCSSILCKMSQNNAYSCSYHIAAHTMYLKPVNMEGQMYWIYKSRAVLVEQFSPWHPSRYHWDFLGFQNNIVKATVMIVLG